LLPEEARERCGEGIVTCMFAAAIMCVCACMAELQCSASWWYEWKNEADSV
jgi:hypothetical protein